ncbi:MAG: virulence RhuM family protein [Chitinivibrionia bacterium]|nr:virulence RhuM family protein [Chitinivibrionia bacterium]
MKNGEIILYQSQDGTTILNVIVENETVWLPLDRMADLFQRDKSTISRHIKNIFKEGELDYNSVVAIFATTAADGKTYQVDYYNLDVIISVGYRVKSQRGTQFRIWANKILKDYIIKGYAINQRFENLENRVSETEKKIDFFVKTSLPPIQGVFFDGQIFDAYDLANKIIKSAKQSIILIDNYIDESVLTMLSKKSKNVKITLLTKEISSQLELDVKKFNLQYPTIEAKIFGDSHDRFLIIDGKQVYHLGASLKDLGKKWFAFSKMDTSCFALLEKISEI